jgi:hypothetical protein
MEQGVGRRWWAAPPSRLALVVIQLLWLPPGQVLAQGRQQPPPPASRPTLYDPDPLTCQADSIRKEFERQLAPFADQSPAVLKRLRQVQAELLTATLQRCVTRGLMDQPTARTLTTELLGSPTANGGQPPPESSSRP